MNMGNEKKALLILIRKGTLECLRVSVRFNLKDFIKDFSETSVRLKQKIKAYE